MNKPLVTPTFAAVVPSSRVSAVTLMSCFTEKEVQRLHYALTGKSYLGCKLTTAQRCNCAKATVRITIEVLKGEHQV